MLQLSIIVPVYNVEQHVERCLDSIFGQNFFGNFEVIVVDDGSTDGSSTILEKYVSKYKNIKVITQTGNKSLAVARRTGINCSKGEYILNIDSDDWIKQGMFEELYRYVIEFNNPDVLVFNYQRIDNSGNIVENRAIKNIEKIGENEKERVQYLFMGTCCNKLVKRNLLDNLIYGKDYMNTTEDLIYSLEVFLKASDIVILPKSYYYYYMNVNSLTSTIFPEKYIESQIIVYKLLNQIVHIYEPKEKYLINVKKYLDKWLIINLFKSHFFMQINERVFNKLMKEYSIFSGVKSQKNLEKNYTNKLSSIKQMIDRVGVMNTIKLIIKLNLK